MKERSQETLREIIGRSFDMPGTFPGMVDDRVTRNRSLHSQERRELTALLHDSIRWRRRIFGDIAPSSVDASRLLATLLEAKALHEKPPLSKWVALSMDSLAKELSYPTWLIQRWVDQLGFESTVSLALSLNEEAPTTFRVNTLKTDRASLLAKLRQEDLFVTEGKWTPLSLHLEGRKNVRSYKAFKQGHFEIQDEGSQITVLTSGAKPGDLVIDACAGAGGKSLALAAQMQNQGSIVATDADARPLERLKERVKRSGATIVETAWVAPDDSAPLSAFREKADLVFVDAPCSSLGTLRRKPWMRWVSSMEGVDRYPKKQRTLLERYSQWVKKGGLLSYVTCTIHKKENEEVVEAFLKEKREFQLRGEPRLLRPDVEGCDGFFFATFQRTSS